VSSHERLADSSSSASRPWAATFATSAIFARIFGGELLDVLEQGVSAPLDGNRVGPSGALDVVRAKCPEDVTQVALALARLALLGREMRVHDGDLRHETILSVFATEGAVAGMGRRPF
jgi:hypothetical protein